TKQYAKAELLDFLAKPGDFNGKSLEMIVGMGGVANVGGAPASFKRETITGFTLYDKDGSGKSTPGFVTKGSNAERVCQGGYMDYQGQGKPQTLYVVRGTAFESTGFPKHCFHIETIEKHEAGAGVAAARPKGRDWFIVMGASGGNGSKEKPFKDPWQALEKC